MELGLIPSESFCGAGLSVTPLDLGRQNSTGRLLIACIYRKENNMSALVPSIPPATILGNVLVIAEQRGCRIQLLVGPGAPGVAHANMQRSCRVNARRKDCPMHLVTWLRSLVSVRGKAPERSRPAWPGSGRRRERGMWTGESLRGLRGRRKRS